MPVFESELRYEISIHAPIGVVFERLSDHEGMADWPGLDGARLVKEGSPKNGVGAVRRVRARGLSLDEEVVRFEPPYALDYRITRGLPVDHLGEVRLSEAGQVTSVSWRVRMRSRVPWLAPLVLWQLRRGLPIALDHVARAVEVPSCAAA